MIGFSIGDINNLQSNYFTLYKIPANTLFVGKNVVFVPECHSTNTLALELSHNQSTTEGTTVITSHQTAGRGQRGNTWHANPNENLTLSILLKPTFLAIRDQFYLNIITSLAVFDLLLETVKTEVRIKWPNDVLINGKKVCGILIENQLQGQMLSTSIAGIGLNVNQRDFGDMHATSISKESGRSWDLQQIFDQLLGHVEQRYLQLRSGRAKELKAFYLSQLFRRGELHSFSSHEQTFVGEILGIDDEGRLAVKVDQAIQYFQVREIKYL